MAKILLIDDDEDILFLVEKSFTQAGHGVVSSSDPRRALPLARNGRFDAIVLDVMMPKISGWNLLEHIRNEPATRSLPVVLLTALSSVSDRVRGLRSGADDYLTKPFEPEELIARVEGLLQRRAEPVAALQGQLAVQSVQEVLQQLEQGRKTGRLTIASEGASGVVELSRGMILSASHGHLAGEEAVLALLERNAGSFAFHPGEPEASAVSPAPSTPPLGIPGLLIRSAWIEDELARRKHLLPSPTIPLQLIAPPPTPSDDFPSLPLEALRDRLRTAPTTEDLVASLPYAPQRILLTIAWLLEANSLVPEPRTVQEPSSAGATHTDSTHTDSTHTDSTHTDSTEAVDPAEDLDVALRELLQVAHFRGLSLDAVRLEFFLDGRSWPRGLELLHGTSPPILRAPGAIPRVPFAHPLEHPAGRFGLHLTPFDSSDDPQGLPSAAPQCLGIVLWLDGGYSAEMVIALASHFIGRAPLAGGVILSPDPAVRQRARNLLEGDPRWQVPTTLPTAFDALLLEVTRTDPPIPGMDAEPWETSR